MSRHKYRALVKLDESDPGSAALAGTTSRITVRAHHHETGRGKFFNALVTAPDSAIARQPDHSVQVTLTVVGDDLPDYLEPGDQLALWRGHDIGHGVITRRLYLGAEGP
jgi:hypothetical protein